MKGLLKYKIITVVVGVFAILVFTPVGNVVLGIVFALIPCGK